VSMRKRTRRRWIRCATDTGELIVSPRLTGLFLRVLEASESGGALREELCARALFETIAELFPATRRPPIASLAACGRA
jgi:hypothetical protein